MQADVFVKVYQEVEKKLYAFALKLTGDASDAEDLLQETVTRAYRFKEQFKEHTNFKAWISTIMRNTFINEYRRKRNIDNTSLDSFDRELGGKEIYVFNSSESNIMMEELGKIIRQVDEKLRIPFLMHYEGYAYQEIADELGLQLGTVKSRIHVARQQLKNLIAVHFQTAHEYA